MDKKSGWFLLLYLPHGTVQFLPHETIQFSTPAFLFILVLQIALALHSPRAPEIAIRDGVMACLQREPTPAVRDKEINITQRPPKIQTKRYTMLKSCVLFTISMCMQKNNQAFTFLLCVGRGHGCGGRGGGCSGKRIPKGPEACGRCASFVRICADSTYDTTLLFLNTAS